MDINSINSFIVYFVIATISVALHELGHFAFLTIGKVKIDDYSIGFGKSLYEKGIFHFRLVQLGGYVKPNRYQLSKLRVTNPFVYLLSMSGGLLVNVSISLIAMVLLYRYYGSEQLLTIKQLLLHDFLHNSEQIDLGQQTHFWAKVLFQFTQINVSLFLFNCIPFSILDGYKIASLFAYPVIKKNNLSKQKEYVELAGLLVYWLAAFFLSKVFG